MPAQAFCTPSPFFSKLGLLEEEISVTLGTQSTLLEDRLVSKGDFKLSLAG